MIECMATDLNGVPSKPSMAGLFYWNHQLFWEKLKDALPWDWIPEEGGIWFNPFWFLKKQQTCWLYPPNFLIVAPRMATRSPSCVDVSILSQSRYPATKDWVQKNPKNAQVTKSTLSSKAITLEVLPLLVNSLHQRWIRGSPATRPTCSAKLELLEVELAVGSSAFSSCWKIHSTGLSWKYHVKIWHFFREYHGIWWDIKRYMTNKKRYATWVSFLNGLYPSSGVNSLGKWWSTNGLLRWPVISFLIQTATTGGYTPFADASILGQRCTRHMPCSCLELTLDTYINIFKSCRLSMPKWHLFVSPSTAFGRLATNPWLFHTEMIFISVGPKFYLNGYGKKGFVDAIDNQHVLMPRPFMIHTGMLLDFSLIHQAQHVIHRNG